MLPVAAARTPPAFFHLLFSTSVLILLAYFAYILRLPDPNSKFLHLAGAGKSVTGDPATFPHFAGWKFNFSSEFDLKICIVSTTSAGLVEILPWILYHKVVGVTDFFLFVQGKAASIEAHRVLNSIQGVKLINRTHELEMQQAKSRIWNESWLDDFKYKPCNYELFTKQTLNMKTGIAMAREAGIDWIVHIDTDELLYPAGSREYSVQKLLSDVPKLVDLVVFPNYESAAEKDDIKLPFHEVTMFKKNYDHLLKEKHDHLIEEAYYVDAEYEENPSYFLTYGNGKSAARIQDNLRPNGAHRWYNYKKEPKEMMFEEAAVLHYSYVKFSDLTSRRQRCNCKLTREAVEKCFMLDFDREAFAIASSGTEEEMLKWYQDNVVWNNEERKLKLLKEGVLTRIYTPMVIMQMLRASGVYSEAFQLSRC